jgi:Protein of unknown function (DUF3303)
MKFIVEWEGPPAVQQAAVERFRKGGGLPPANVKMLGRWHTIGQIHGFAIVEADSSDGLAAWVLEWGDLFTFKVTPALSDEELGATLAAVQAR